MKTLLKKGLAVILITELFFGCAGCSSEDSITSSDENSTSNSDSEKEVTNELGNNLYNICNGSDFAIQGDYIYIVHDKNIYKCKSGDEANDQVQLTYNSTDNGIYNPQVLGKWVYYIYDEMLCRISTDGGEVEELSYDWSYRGLYHPYLLHYAVTKDKIFFTKTEYKDTNTSTDYVVYKPMDALDKYAKLQEGKFEGIDSDGRIHYSKYDKNTDETFYYSMDQEGENVKQENSEFTVPVEVAGYTITIDDNPDKENHKYDDCLFATKKGTSDKMQVNTDDASTAWPGDDGYIYYDLHFYSGDLYRVKPDGSKWQNTSSWFS